MGKEDLETLVYKYLRAPRRAVSEGLRGLDGPRSLGVFFSHKGYRPHCCNGFYRQSKIGVKWCGGQMKGTARCRNLLLVVCLWSLLAVQAHSCPEACSRCSGHKHYQCEECRSGWTLHNNTCVDVDECGSELDTCLSNTYCFNTQGSFQCRGCDAACAGCRGAGPAHCRKCAPGYRFTGSKCLDIDECSDRVLACPGLDEICINTHGSFHCDCAEGFIRMDGVCVREKLPDLPEKGLFDDIKDDEVEVLKQMFFGVVLCALGTLAAKGDMVYTSVFIGAVAGMAGYWFSERGDHVMNRFLKEP